MITTAQTESPVDITKQLESLHRHYVQISGMEIRWSSAMLYWWERWTAQGFTQADLDLVIAYIKKRIRDKRRGIESLAIRNLIARPDSFAEDLAIAKAEQRSFRPQTERQKILTATGRHGQKHSEPKSTKSIIGAKSTVELLADLRKAVI